MGRQLCIPGECQPQFKQVSLGPRASRCPLPASPPPSASAALCQLKLLGCAVAQRQHLLGEASCPGSLPGRGSSARFAGKVLGSACCQRAEGPSHLRGLLAVRPSLLPAPCPSQKLQFPALETLEWVKGHPAPVSLEFMKRRLFT